mgnify:CR=1 FL=1
MRREKESLLSIVFPYPNAPDGYSPGEGAHDIHTH